MQPGMPNVSAPRRRNVWMWILGVCIAGFFILSVIGFVALIRPYAPFIQVIQNFEEGADSQEQGRTNDAKSKPAPKGKKPPVEGSQ